MVQVILVWIAMTTFSLFPSVSAKSTSSKNLRVPGDDDEKEKKDGTMTKQRRKGKGSGKNDKDGGGLFCGCESCTMEALEVDACGDSCGNRIDYLVTVEGLSELDACTVIAEVFVDFCAPCNPDTC